MQHEDIEDIVKMHEDIDYESADWISIIQALENLKDRMLEILSQYGPGQDFLYDGFRCIYDLTANIPNRATKKRLMFGDEKGKTYVLSNSGDKNGEEHDFLLESKLTIDGQSEPFSVIIKHSRKKTKELVEKVICIAIEKEIEFQKTLKVLLQKAA